MHTHTMTGHTLARWRNDVGATTAAMARELGVSQASWRGWEAGRCLPQQDAREAIARLTSGAVPAEAWQRDVKPRRRRKPRPRPNIDQAQVRPWVEIPRPTGPATPEDEVAA